MDDRVIPSLTRTATIQTVVPVVTTPLQQPVIEARPTVYAKAPVIPPPVRSSLVSVPETPRNTSGVTVLSGTNLAPDISTYYSKDESYFQLSSTAPPVPDTWYNYPTQTGSVLFDVSGGTKSLTATGEVMAYDGQSLMPATWYLNPSLNGEVLLVDASGTQTLRSIDANLYFNNELLAKAGQIENVADWSLYPSLQNVDINHYNLNNVGTIDASGGNFVQVTTTGLTSTTGSITGALAVGSLNSAGSISAGPLQPAAVVSCSNFTSFAGASDPAMKVSAFNGLTVQTSSNGMTFSSAANISNTATTSINNLATTNYTVTAGSNFNVLVDRGINPISSAGISLDAKNGAGGLVTITADPAQVTPVGGKIALTANGGTVTIDGTPYTVGGEIDIDANTGTPGLYTLTSAVKIGASGVNSYAGAIPSVGSAAGYNFIYGTAGVNLCAGLPSSGFQFPGTIYQYAVGSPVYGGIRLESPFGIQMLSNTYLNNLYPLDAGGLTIQGRTAPDANVTITDVQNLTTTTSGSVNTDFINSKSSVGIFYKDTLKPLSTQGIWANTLQPPNATAPGAPNLTISGNAALGNQNFVEIQNADTISFDVSGAGALTGVQTINGSVYPPTPATPALWSTYKAVSTIDASGNSLINVPAISATAALDISATAINLLAPVSVGTVGTPQTLTVNGTASATTVNSSGDVVSSFGGSTPTSLNTIGGLVNGPQQYNYWVAVNGNDVTGTGSVLRPFATVGAALTATAGISDTLPVNICLTAGTYTENPTVTRNNTFIVGNVGVADAVIIGTLTFNPTATAAVNQGMTGISVVGNVVCADATTQDCSWYFQHSNITSYTVSALVENSNGTGNNVVVLYNTVITQNTTANAAVVLNSSRLNAIQAQINNTTTSACISSNGTGSMSLFGVTLTAAGGATASALITYINATTNGSASTFTLCTFTYTAGTVGAGKTAVFFNNAGALAGATTFSSNIFNIAGSSTLIQRPGAGAVAITWGANTSNVTTLPAAGGGLTYTYTPSTTLRANSLQDSAASAGTAGQYLTAGSAGASLAWSSLTASSLGALAATPAATAYQNQLVMFNTSTNTLSYDTQAYGVQIGTAPSTIALATTQRGRIFILTSAGAQTVTFTTATLTANDVGFFVKVKNGNANGGGDLTIAGATGNTTVHNNTATATMGFAILYWTGSALVAY